MASRLSRQGVSWTGSLCRACQSSRSIQHGQQRMAMATQASATGSTMDLSPALREAFASLEPLDSYEPSKGERQAPRVKSTSKALKAAIATSNPKDPSDVEEATSDEPRKGHQAKSKTRAKGKVSTKAKTELKTTISTRKPKKRAAGKTPISASKAAKAKSIAIARKAKQVAVPEQDINFTQQIATQTAVGAVVDVAPPENIPVPSLAHGLDRVLFNPGVYYLQDPRSHIYNFDPYLQQITPVEEFNFDALSEYITSSRDSTLDELARENGLSVVGSTSSMTTTLAQFHFLLSANRPVNLSRLSTAFVGKSTDFTPSQRAPTSIYLRHNDGIYAIDADKSLDSGETVLSFLGRSMEKMLTLVPEDFSKLRKDRQAEPRPAPSRESYHYSKIGQMLMRSQLDCHDPRLPGTGTFDLKTRAVLPVRLDVRNHATGAGYQIVRSTGILESFEREYYDMIRAAFLKYSLQVRIGKMDGIFVAYHNTERIFGFQYISIDEMDECLHGSSTDNIAGREFVMSLKQLDKVLKMAIDKYPGRSMCLSFQTTTGKKPVMEIVVEAMSEEEIQKRQQGELYAALKAAQNDEQIETLSSPKKEKAKKTLESMSSTLEQIMDQSKSGTPAKATESKAEKMPTKEGEKRERMLLRIEGRSFINDKAVTGPPMPSATDLWQYKFDITTIDSEESIAARLEDIKKKRVAALTDLGPARGFDKYRSELKKVSDAGRVKLNERIKEREDVEPVVYQARESVKALQEQYDKSFRTE